MEATSTPSEIIAANLTKKGQVSGVIKSASNYIIFRLDDIKPEVIKPFQSVKTEIADSLKNEKAINAFYSLQQTASRAAMDDNESLAAAEKVTGIKAVTTDWFSRNNFPEEIRFDKVADSIFNGNLLDKNRPTGIRGCRHKISAQIAINRIWMLARKEDALLANRVAIPLHCLIFAKTHEFRTDI